MSLPHVDRDAGSWPRLPSCLLPSLIRAVPGPRPQQMLGKRSRPAAGTGTGRCEGSVLSGHSLVLPLPSHPNSPGAQSILNQPRASRPLWGPEHPQSAQSIPTPPWGPEHPQSAQSIPTPQEPGTHVTVDALLHPIAQHQHVEGLVQDTHHHGF